jgi:hypothetical protein
LKSGEENFSHLSRLALETHPAFFTAHIMEAALWLINSSATLAYRGSDGEYPAH